MFATIRELKSANREELFMTPGKPEEQDPATGNYSACSEQGYCMIYDSKGLIIEHSQQH
jgi:hypothetical protein